MSVENVKKFYEALSQDEAMKQKFVELSQKYQGQPMDEVKAAAVMEQEGLLLAKQQGYSISMDDLKSYGKILNPAEMNGELSDEELQAVVGGTTEGRCAVLGYYSNGKFACFLAGEIYYAPESFFRCFLYGGGHNTNT